VSASFEEIDRADTPIGVVTVRRRLDPTLHVDVYEVKLGDEFLMSSLFTVAEIALVDLALAELAGADLDVVVGGLGLGYTARAALADDRVGSVHVVEALDAVVGWHRDHLVPLASALTDDPRCHLITGDFFALVASEAGFGPEVPDRCDAVLLDIDHSPRHLLHPAHGSFYAVDGLQRLTERLRPGGVFAMWADGGPDDDFLGVLDRVFTSAVAHEVRFPNPYTDTESASTVYVAHHGTAHAT